MEAEGDKCLKTNTMTDRRGVFFQLKSIMWSAIRSLRSFAQRSSPVYATHIDDNRLQTRPACLLSCMSFVCEMHLIRETQNDPVVSGKTQRLTGASFPLHLYPVTLMGRQICLQT